MRGKKDPGFYSAIKHLLLRFRNVAHTVTSQSIQWHLTCRSLGTVSSVCIILHAFIHFLKHADMQLSIPKHAWVTLVASSRSITHLRFTQRGQWKPDHCSDMLSMTHYHSHLATFTHMTRVVAQNRIKCLRGPSIGHLPVIVTQKVKILALGQAPKKEEYMRKDIRAVFGSPPNIQSNWYYDLCIIFWIFQLGTHVICIDCALVQLVIFHPWQ